MRSTLGSLLLPILLVCGVLCVSDAQNPPSPTVDSAHLAFAVNLVRAINTAEGDYKQSHGTYATWQALAPSTEFQLALKWASGNSAGLTNLQVSKEESVFQGWKLRLTVDGEAGSYDVLLENTLDRACSSAVMSNETGLIRYGKSIQCTS